MRATRGPEVFRRARAVVGLDIGSSAVKAVELKGSGRSYKVTAFGVEPVPPDSIVDGAIIDGAAVADAIRHLFESKNIKTKNVAASLAGNAVIVKKITLPKMTEQELAESIYWEAEQYIPFDIQDVNLDYQVVGQGNGAASGTMDVLLVAAKKEKIADYTGVITRAGRAPVIVDVDAFALQSAYEVNYGLDTAQVIALVNFGASAVNINILSGGQSLFTRDISIGGNAYTDALQRELNLPYETADALKRGVPINGCSIEMARPILRAVTENVLLEIQKTFDFFRGTTGADRIDRLVVSGGASRVDGFIEMLAERFDLRVELFNPFRKVAFDPARLGVIAAPDVQATSVVAVGLALRKVGDR
jgi:type IV pilus assembly protein PilM